MWLRGWVLSLFCFNETTAFTHLSAASSLRGLMFRLAASVSAQASASARVRQQMRAAASAALGTGSSAVRATSSDALPSLPPSAEQPATALAQAASEKASWRKRSRFSCSTAGSEAAASVSGGAGNAAANFRGISSIGLSLQHHATRRA